MSDGFRNDILYTLYTNHLMVMFSFIYITLGDIADSLSNNIYTWEVM